MEVLFEIGTEELPAESVYSAVEQIRGSMADGLSSSGLGECDLRIFATPRRLAVLVEGIPGETASTEIRKKGPPLNAAKGPDGEWTKAATGFAKAQGVEVEDLIVEESPGGSYVLAVRVEQGRKADEILPGLFTGVLESIKFTKSMRWGSGEERFSRPVRWIMAINQDGGVIPVEFARLSSSNITYGHRYLSEGPIEITNPSTYQELLRTNFVIADPDERESVILNLGERICGDHGFIPEFNRDVLREVVQLVEWPGVVIGDFDEGHLRVPREVLVHSMEEHQRYFPVIENNGKITNRFLAVHNGGRDYEDIIRNGNERVLAARLADAEFFFDEDLKKTLADRVDDLKQVVFKSELGSMREKSTRLAVIAGSMADKLGLDAGIVNASKRAAMLAKCDLVTHMVIEFPGLQGVIGGIYAGLTGETEEVASAIGEQYMPRSAGEGLPKSVTGSILSVCERVDNIAASFGLGHVPSGSEDPYGLRRQSVGMIMIIIDKEFAVSVTDMVRESAGLIEAEAHGFKWDDVAEEAFRGFFISREKSYFYEKGYRYDLVDASIEAEWDRPLAASRLLDALVKARDSGLLARLYTGFERCYNLSKGQITGEPERKLSKEKVEIDLLDILDNTAPRVEGLLSDGEYSSALDALGPLSEAVDRLFDGVMIMDEDLDVRANRLSLLGCICNLYRKVAEFSRLKWD